MMNVKLLFVAALTFSSGVFAQEQKVALSVDRTVQRVATGATVASRGQESRATIFSQVFDGPGLGQFTATHGATSTAPHWTYVETEGGATCYVTTNAQAASTFDEYLTVTDPIVIPDPAVDSDIYRLQVDMGVDYGWLNAARGGMGNLKIQLSNDNGATWTDFWFEEDATMLRNTFTSYLPNYDGIASISPIINIPNAYRVADFKFRISLTGTNTADHVVYGASVYSVPTDYSYVRTNFLYNGDIINDFEYGRIPVSQAGPMVAGLVATNEGFSTASRDVTFIVRRGNAQVHSEDVTVQYALAQCDTLFHELNYTPNEAGLYTLVAVSRGGEQDVRDSVVFEVTESILSQSMVSDLDWITSRSTLAGFVSQFAIRNNGDVYVANAYLWNNTTVSQNVLIMLHRFNGTTWVTEYTGEHTITAADLSSNGNVRPLYFEFEYSVELMAEDFVRLELRKGATGTVGILAKGGDNDNGSLIYGDFGSAGLAYYGGVGYSYGLELDFQNRASVAKVEGMENVTVYPNPTNGLVNVTNSSNDVLSINVVDVTGKQIMTTSVYGNGTVDLSSFGSGVYLLEMNNGVSRASQRVIVK